MSTRAHCMFTVCTLCVNYMFTVCLLYVHCMSTVSTVCPLRVHLYLGGCLASRACDCDRAGRTLTPTLCKYAWTTSPLASFSKATPPAAGPACGSAKWDDTLLKDEELVQQNSSRRELVYLITLPALTHAASWCDFRCHPPWPAKGLRKPRSSQVDARICWRSPVFTVALLQ